MQSTSSNPQFICTVNDHEQGLDPKTYLLNKKRTIWLNSTIDEEAAFNVVTAIAFLADKSDEDITLYINSPGGNVGDGLAILDAMQATD